MSWDSNAVYERYKAIFKGQRFPLAFVDLDHFDQNVATVAETQRRSGKTIRIASKSIRCIELIQRVFENGGKTYKGILAFTMEEAGFLSDNGFDDIVVAYPSIQESDLSLLVEKTLQGADISAMVDSPLHLKAWSRVGENAGIQVKICLDVDMSYRLFNDLFHFGVRRSPVHTEDQILELAQMAGNLPGIKLSGLMGYEAQIASVNDNYPSRYLKNAVLRQFKKASIAELTLRRQRIVRALATQGISLDFVNGGGSGSLVSTGQDDSVTEVTAGSAFYAPGLFRYFHEIRFSPSAFFALQVVRKPGKGMITCQGGGYVGSGEVNKNRLPWPVLPRGLSYLTLEGAGEVQTPLKLPAHSLELDVCDPVFFQHAKAGELCERFNHLYLVEEGKIIGSVPTYRGQGKAFL